MKEEISKEEIRNLEKAIIDNAGVETLDAIKRRAADLRAEHIENAFVPIREQMNDLNRSTNELQANLSRDEWEKQIKAADKVRDQESYESYLKERQILIDTNAAIQKQALEQIEKQRATARIKELAVERQKRDGGTIAEAERVIRLESGFDLTVTEASIL